MGLRNLTFPTIEVQTSGGPLPVRGLSLDHILGLFYRHRKEISALYESLISRVKAGESTSDDITVLAIQLVDAAPLIAAEIVALAAGSNPTDFEGFVGDVGIVRGLSIAEQIDALEKIAGQTFTSDMPAGKVFALALQAMQAGSSAASSLPSPPSDPT